MQILLEADVTSMLPCREGVAFFRHRRKSPYLPWNHPSQPLFFIVIARTSLIFAFALLLLHGSIFGPCPVSAAVIEQFEGAKTSWRLGESDASVQIREHVRTGRNAHSGRRSEFLQITASLGTHVYFWHKTGCARIVDELKPSIWVKSDRAGLQLMVRIVLPRVKDPKTGAPLTTLIRGATYTDVGSWQQLVVDRIPQLLTRQVRILRSQIGPHVDAREAYVDLVVLNAYGGRGVTSVWVDDLVVAGFVEAVNTVEPSCHVPRSVQRYSHGDVTASNATGRSADGTELVRLQGTMLTVAGHAFFPRIIQYQGEPFEQLRALGFNTIQLDHPPTRDQLEKAESLGLWLICPPPTEIITSKNRDLVSSRDLVGSRNAASDRASCVTDLGPCAKRVLAWDLGEHLSRQDLESVRQRANQLRRSDTLPQRPLLCLPDSNLWAYARHANILLTERDILGTEAELSDFGPWLQSRANLARPGTPMWAAIQTQPPQDLMRQWTALRQGHGTDAPVQADQIRLLAYTAIAAGQRGLAFRSRSRLDANDPATQLRAIALELINLELFAIEPWAAAGAFRTTATCSDPAIQASVLETERAQLLIATRYAAGSQYAVVPSSRGRITFVIPGVPQSYEAYQLTPTGLRPLRRERVTGGVRITIDGFAMTSLIVLTENPLVIRGVTQRLANTQERSARLRRALAAQTLALVETVYAQLERPHTTAPLKQWLNGAKTDLKRCSQFLAAEDFEQSNRAARRAMTFLQHIQRILWQQRPAPFASSATDPFCASVTLLPNSHLLAKWLVNARVSQNLLAGGDFENPNAMQRDGWEFFRHHDQGVRSEVELSKVEHHAGRYSLRMSALAKSQEKNTSAPQFLETPPVWIESAPVPVRQGQLVRIHGWVHVPKPITGSFDGLMVLDSLGGEALAKRFQTTSGWQEFTLLRAVDHNGTFRLTFALTGFGEVYLDNITVQIVETSH